MIVTKRQANSEIVNSLFTAGRTMTAIKFDSGKYEWHGSAAATWQAARERDAANVAEIESLRLPVWIERRTDEHGPYAQIMTTTNDKGQN